MTSFQLIEAIGSVPVEMLHKALQPKNKQRRRTVQVIGLAAACLCIVFSGVYMFNRLQISPGQVTPAEVTPETNWETVGSGGGSATEVDAVDGSPINQFYMGPVLPMTLKNENSAIAASREISYDFAPCGEQEQLREVYGEDITALLNRYLRLTTSAVVTDEYTLTNTSDQMQTITVEYPFVSSYEDLTWSIPTIAVNSESVNTSLEAQESTESFETWRDYNGLMSGTQTTANTPESDSYVGALQQMVSILEFQDVSQENCFVHIETDGAADQVLWRDLANAARHEDTITGDIWYKLYAANDYDRYTSLYFIGAHVTGYQFATIENAQSDAAIITPMDAAGITVNQDTMPLNEFLLMVVQREWSDFNHGEGLSPIVSQEQFMYSLYQDGLDDYGGDLGELLGATACQKRIFCLSFDLEISPGESVALSAQMLKDGSYNVTGYGTGKTFDLLTRAGSNLRFDAQNAILETRNAVTVVNQNFGFNQQAERDQVELDISVEHYYMEVIRKE